MYFELFIIQVLAHCLVTIPLVGGAIALAIHFLTEVRASRERGWDRQQGLQPPADREAAPELQWDVQCAPARCDAAAAAPARAPAPASGPWRRLYQAMLRDLLGPLAFVPERGGRLVPAGAAGRWLARETPEVVSPHGLKPRARPQSP